MFQNSNRWSEGVDWLSIFLALAILIFGLLNVYSVDNDRGIKQLIWLGLSFIIIFSMIIAYSQNKNFFESYSPIFYAISLLLLVAVLFFGKEINGAKAWFSFSGFSLQPAEFAKVTTALVLANFVSRRSTNDINSGKSLYSIAILIALPCLLILLQPDLGSVIVFTAFMLALYREGLSIWFAIIPIVGLFLFLFSIFYVPFYCLLLFGYSILVIVLLALYFNYNKEIERNLYGVLIGLLIFFLLLIGTLYIVIYFDDFFNKLHTEIYPDQTFFFNDPVYFNTILFSSIGAIVCLIPLVVMKLKSSAESSSSPFKSSQTNIRSDFVITSSIISSIIFIFTISVSLVSPILFDSLPKHHKERIMVLYEGEKKYRDTSGYNLLYSKTAIGSGDLFGKGYNQGTVKMGRFVPEQWTDYIFCTVGEEWGFVGSSTLVLVYALFIMRLFYLAESQKSVFSRFYGYATASILLLHYFLNIAMVLGLFPTVGIPLPFFSYGGSSLWGFSILITIFLILNYKDKQSL